MNSIRILRQLNWLANSALLISPLLVLAVLVSVRGGALTSLRSILWLILVSLVLVQSFYLILSRKETARTPVDIFVLLLCVFYAAGFFYSYSPERSWTELNNVLAYALVFVFVSQAIRSKTESILFTRTIVAIGLFFALHNIYLAISGVPGAIFIEETRIRLLGPFGYANIFAVFVVMIAPLAIHLTAVAKNRIEEICMACVSGLLVFAVALTYSRGAIIAGIGVLAVMLIMAPKSSRLRYLKDLALIVIPVLLFADSLGKSTFTATTEMSKAGYSEGLRYFYITISAMLSSTALTVGLAHETRTGSASGTRKLAFILPSILLIYGLAFLFGTYNRATYQGVRRESLETRQSGLQSRGKGTQTQTQNLLSLADQAQPQRVDRIWLWRLSIESIKERPFFGTGPGTFTLSFLARRDRPREAIDPHNMYLRLLTEVGIIGFLPFAAVLVVLFLLVGKLILKSTDLGRDSPVPAYAAGSLGFLAHSAIDTEWTFPAIVLLFFIYLGFVSSANRMRGRTSTIKLLSVALASLVAFLLILSPLQSERMLAAGKAEIKKLNFKKAQRRFIRAKMYNPVSATAYAELARLYQTMYHLSGSTNYLKLSEKEYSGALSRDSHSAMRYLQFGEFLFVEYKDQSRALGFFKKAAVLDPLDPTPYLRMKDIYLASGDFDKAKQAELDGNHRNWLWGQVLMP
jgi:hypothetical protein